MKVKPFVFLFLLLCGAAHATEVTIDPNVSWYDTKASGELSIWTTGTNCEPLKASPQSGNIQAGQVRFWAAQLLKAQGLNKSVGVGYDPSTCAITYMGRMR